MNYDELVKNKNPKAIFIAEAGINHDGDISKAKEVAMKVIHSSPYLINKSKAIILVSELGDSSVNLLLRSWAKPADYQEHNSLLLQKIKEQFAKEGIEIPFPKRDVNIISND